MIIVVGCLKRMLLGGLFMARPFRYLTGGINEKGINVTDMYFYVVCVL